MSDNNVAPCSSGDSSSRTSGGARAGEGGLLDALETFASEFDPHFEPLLTPGDDVPERLQQAVRHSALAPGKRIRPYLLVRCCELAGGSRERVWQVAAAIECVHAFSLIHDDLPAMDDDDLRRGRPTCHRAFDEATAILAGDALLARAFELLATCDLPGDCRGRLVADLAAGTGWRGMIGGQAADVEGEKLPPDVELARYIHERKTAALFEKACRMGVTAGGGADDLIDRLGMFGHHLGVAFQIADDLLDVLQTDTQLGKRTGKDAQAGKQSFPRCVGLEDARVAARASLNDALACLDVFDTEAEDLRRLARYVVDRNY